ncbi:MAG: type II secretion system F family protein [Gammaproteobacteria bacterium]|nr:type II secretion system F family protein [Gammaproteobacteria bacterium]
MPGFHSQAVDARGRGFEGTLRAASAEDAAQILDRKGLLITRLVCVARPQDGGETPAARRRGKAVDVKTLLDFTDALSALLRSGMTLEQALTITRSVLPARGRALVDDLLHDVRGGAGLSEALAAEPGIPAFYVSLVRSGELSGQLGTLLQRLGEALARAREVRASIINSAIYPVILVAVMIASLLFLFTAVVPKFAAMFQGVSVRIPAATYALIRFSEFLNRHGLAVALTPAVLLIGGAAFFKSAAGRAWLDRRVLGWPIVGPLLINLELSRVFRTAGALLAGGVPLASAIAHTADVPGNGALRRAWRELYQRLVAGNTLEQALAQVPVLPTFVRQFIQIGSETGRMDQMMLSLAARMEQDLDTSVKRLLALVEPAAILIMGLLIGAVVVAILSAVFSINAVQV